MDQPTWDSVKETATETAQSAAQSAAQTAKQAVPGLSTFECKHRGTACTAGYAYDAVEGAFHEGRGGERPAWICENDDCGAKFRRESSSGILVLRD